MIFSLRDGFLGLLWRALSPFASFYGAGGSICALRRDSLATSEFLLLCIFSFRHDKLFQRADIPIAYTVSQRIQIWIQVDGKRLLLAFLLHWKRALEISIFAEGLKEHHLFV